MSSEFDDFMSTAFETAASLIGESSLTIAGIDRAFTGVLDRVVRSEGRESGAFIPGADATIVCARSQFADVPPVGRDCTVDGNPYTIATFEQDSVSYTIHLALRVAKSR